MTAVAFESDDNAFTGGILKRSDFIVYPVPFWGGLFETVLFQQGCHVRPDGGHGGQPLWIGHVVPPFFSDETEGKKVTAIRPEIFF